MKKEKFSIEEDLWSCNTTRPGGALETGPELWQEGVRVLHPLQSLRVRRPLRPAPRPLAQLLPGLGDHLPDLPQLVRLQLPQDHEVLGRRQRLLRLAGLAELLQAEPLPQVEFVGQPLGVGSS